MSNFMDLATNGYVLLEEIDDFVDAWHESDSDEALEEYLGMASDEYAVWVDDSAMLPQLVAARHQRIPIADFKSYYNEARLAARANKSDVVRTIALWLERRHGNKT